MTTSQQTAVTTDSQDGIRALAVSFYDQKMADVDRQQGKGEEYVNTQREAFVTAILNDAQATDRLLEVSGLALFN